MNVKDRRATNASSIGDDAGRVFFAHIYPQHGQARERTVERMRKVKAKCCTGLLQRGTVRIRVRPRYFAAEHSRSASHDVITPSYVGLLRGSMTKWVIPNKECRGQLGTPSHRQAHGINSPVSGDSRSTTQHYLFHPQGQRSPLTPPSPLPHAHTSATTPTVVPRRHPRSPGSDTTCR